MAAETILVDLHSRLLGLTARGNLKLNGKLLPDATNRVGFPKLVGPTIPTSVTTVAAAGTSNVSNVTFQVVDEAGTAITNIVPITIWLSDASTGIGLTTTTASGGIAAVTSGTVLGALTTSKAIRAITDATGKFILAITDTAKTHFYPCAALDGQQAVVGTQLATNSYG